MISHKSLFLPSVIAACIAVSAGDTALASTLYWDANGAGAGTGGAGDWSGSALWRADSDTGTLQVWADTNAAVLGGTAGTIAINTSTVTTSSLSVTTTGYTITSSTRDRSLKVTGNLALDANVALTLEKSNTGGVRFDASSISGGAGSSLILGSGVTGTNAFELAITGESSLVSVPIVASGTGGGLIGVTGLASFSLAGGISNSSNSTTLIRANLGNTVTLVTTGLSGTSGVVFGGGGGDGTVLLNVASNYSGATTLHTSSSSGKVRLGLSDALPTGTSLTLTQGTLELQGYSQKVASLAGSGGAISGTTGSVFRVEGTSSTTYSGTTSGAVSLEKAGSGVLTLATAQGYTGTTSISGGTLVVNGGLTGSGAVTVAAGGKLAGTGAIAGATTIQSGGKYSPGAVNATGSQAFSSSLTFNSGSIFEWDLNAPTTDPGTAPDSGVYDKLTATGVISGASAAFAIILDTGDSFADAFWNTQKTWTDIFTGGTGSSTLASIFSSFSGAGIVSETVEGQLRGTVGDRGYFTFDGGSLNFTAVPEPTTALAGLLLAAGLMRRRRG